MELQNPQHNEQLQLLISEADSARNSFLQLQEKATEIKNNIERNKKTIIALENDNIELQSKSDKAMISDTGEVTFKEFDECSNAIFNNNRKIQALRKVIEKFEKQLELTILDDCQNAYKYANLKISKVFEFYATALLNELLNDDLTNKLNTILYLLKSSKMTNGDEAIIFILESIKNKFSNSFEFKLNHLNNLSFPSFQSYGYSNYSVIESKRRIEELKNQLENNTIQ